MKRGLSIIRGMDVPLVFIVIGLILYGMTMIYSSSQYWAYEITGNSAYYLVRQARFAIVGLIGMFLVSQIDYHWWRRLAIPVGVIVLIVLIAMLFMGGRWLREGSYQPSEICKLGIVIYIAAWLASKGDKIEQASYGVIPFAIIVGANAGLIMAQPDLGTALLVILTTLVMFFVAGAQIKQLLLLVVFGGAAVALPVRTVAYQVQRVLDWLRSNPLSGLEQSEGWLAGQAAQALERGGFFGVGLGRSEAARILGRIAHTDAIFAIIGEELGLVGALAMLGLLAGLAYRGLRVALEAGDEFGMLLAVGITTQMLFQATVHIGVALRVLPEKGITLPFVSYGGSSLLASLIGVGLLLSISRGLSNEPTSWEQEEA